MYIICKILLLASAQCELNSGVCIHLEFCFPAKKKKNTVRTKTSTNPFHAYDSNKQFVPICPLSDTYIHTRLPTSGIHAHHIGMALSGECEVETFYTAWDIIIL